MSLLGERARRDGKEGGSEDAPMSWDLLGAEKGRQLVPALIFAFKTWDVSVWGSGDGKRVISASRDHISQIFQQ